MVDSGAGAPLQPPYDIHMVIRSDYMQTKDPHTTTPLCNARLAYIKRGYVQQQRIDTPTSRLLGRPNCGVEMCGVYVYFFCVVTFLSFLY